MERYMPLTGIDLIPASLLIDTQAPLDVLQAMADYRIRTVTQVLENIAFRAELTDMLRSDAVLVMPTAPSAAPLKTASQQQMQAYRDQALKLMCLASLSGFPQITLPIGEVGGAPFGVSLLGPPGSDIALIRLGRRILQTAGKV